ncbi:MAG: helix-turn-helix domain-containing protein [Dysgonomonas sp.]
MSLLYVNEHLNCIHSRRKIPVVRTISLDKGGRIAKTFITDTTLCFLKEGKLCANADTFSSQIIKEQEIFLLPANSYFEAEILENVYCLIIEFNVQVHLCENFSMTQLYSFYEKIDEPSEFCVLPFNQRVSDYVNLFAQYLEDGVNCIHLHEMKKKEAFFLLRAYYPKELLAKFFYPILDKEDLYFKDFVLEKCLCAKNVQELAGLANYSTSGFIKKFNRCFDDSPYRWITQYKANKILHDINDGRKSFKEIYTEYRFSSMPHFIEFCKKHFGQTPGKMRKKK